jgi:hypothetical protein
MPSYLQIVELYASRHAGTHARKGAQGRAAARRIAAGLDPDDEISGTGVIAVSPATDDEPFRRRARLSWAAQRPEPLAHSPPLQEELLYAS